MPHLFTEPISICSSSVIKHVKFDAMETVTDKNSALTLLIKFETDLVNIQRKVHQNVKHVNKESFFVATRGHTCEV